MKVMMLTTWSPVKGERLQAGQVVDVPDEVALDMIQREIAKPAPVPVERAVGPGQV